MPIKMPTFSCPKCHCTRLVEYKSEAGKTLNYFCEQCKYVPKDPNGLPVSNRVRLTEWLQDDACRRVRRQVVVKHAITRPRDRKDLTREAEDAKKKAGEGHEGDIKP